MEKEFMVYLTASESKSKPGDVKTCRLSSAIGPKAREIYYTFTFEDDAMKFDNVIEHFDQYFTPKKNVTYMRYKFFSCNQSEGQNIDAYVTELRKRAEHCEFAELKNSLIRDKIVIGIRDKKTQERYSGNLNSAWKKLCKSVEQLRRLKYKLMKWQVAQRALRRLTMFTARDIGLVKGQINIGPTRNKLREVTSLHQTERDNV